MERQTPGALSRLLILPSEGLISKGARFVLRAFFCCVPVMSFSTEKALSIGWGGGGKKEKGKKKPKKQPHTFLAMGCFSKQLIKRRF